MFQVSGEGYSNIVNIPEVMYNENVADFELYAGMYYGYLIAFLESFSEVMKNRLPEGKMHFGSGNPRIDYGKKIPPVYLWIEKLLDQQVQDSI